MELSSAISLYRSPLLEGYRSKMEYTFGDSTPGGPLTLGLHRPGYFYDILPTPLCNIVPEDFNSLRKAVERFCREREWTALDTTEFLRLLHSLSLSMRFVSVYHTTNDSVADVV